MTQATLATFFGLRITPVDIDESRAYRLRDLAFDIEDERATMRRWARSKWTSEEERDEALAESTDRIREIVAQAVEIRDGVRPDVSAQAAAQSPGDRPSPTEEPSRRFILRRPPAAPATPPRPTDPRLVGPAGRIRDRGVRVPVGGAP